MRRDASAEPTLTRTPAVHRGGRDPSGAELTEAPRLAAALACIERKEPS
jgi:hypothetical protein